MTNYWWVNQNQTYKEAIAGGFMWSPKKNKNGGYNPFYENMNKVQIGDIVFSFSNTFIKAVGIITAPARSSEKPVEFGKAGNSWDDDGWLVEVEYSELERIIKPKNHMQTIAPLLPKKYSPIRANGGGNQMYFAEIPYALAAELILLIGSQINVAMEISQERKIKNRTDIGATEKYQLTKSRIGQGQYRKNLEQYEKGCRITGVNDSRFLTASHIKPWAKCNDFEKIDGNNGLLLSPHIDRLFDRGFISFHDNGELIISNELPLKTINAWSLQENITVKKLSSEQIIYMDYHKKYILK